MDRKALIWVSSCAIEAATQLSKPPLTKQMLVSGISLFLLTLIFFIIVADAVVDCVAAFLADFFFSITWFHVLVPPSLVVALILTTRSKSSRRSRDLSPGILLQHRWWHYRNIC